MNITETQMKITERKDYNTFRVCGKPLGQTQHALSGSGRKRPVGDITREVLQECVGSWVKSREHSTPLQVAKNVFLHERV